jgi:hypothetical protein
MVLIATMTAGHARNLDGGSYVFGYLARSTYLFLVTMMSPERNMLEVESASA